jgi:uncharacterized protein (TIGR04222 family)
MTLISAPGDTWGISGPDFLAVYLGAAVVFLIVALVFRLSVTRSGPDHMVRQPSRGEIAYLTGGASQAMYSSLAGLRAVGAVGLVEKGTLSRTGPAPDGMTRLDEAVYDAAGRGVRVADLMADVRVRSALDELALIVERAGWLVDDAARTRARIGAFLLLALAVFGIVRTVAGLANGRPVGIIIVATIVIAVVGLILLRVPRLTSAARNALNQTVQANRHLAPSQSPSWATYGLSGAALGVALYGTSAMWVADPAFAQDAGIIKQSTNPATYAGSTGGDGGGGGGSDGGGGGGCGGGGCGGGGCGG